jgi:hypothetical protein
LRSSSLERVVQQVVAGAQAVQQVAGGQVDVRLAVGVAPDRVADRRVHVALGGFQVSGLAFDPVGQRGPDDADGGIVLRAAFLRRRCGRILAQGDQPGQRLLPLARWLPLARRRSSPVRRPW